MFSPLSVPVELVTTFDQKVKHLAHISHSSDLVMDVKNNQKVADP